MLGHHCASPKGGRCDVPCDAPGEPRATVYLDGPWMPEHGPREWPQCPVRDTYEDPDIRRMLAVRRQHSLTGTVDLDGYAAWVGDLWGQLEALYTERREKERAEG